MPAIGEQPVAADERPRRPSTRAVDAVAGDGLERLDRPEARARRALARATIAAAERMLAAAFERGREVEHLGRVEPGRRLDRDDLRPAGGQRAGLVEDDRDHASAASSASPPRNRIPASAPRPVPTMIAVGVARPIAHGQATMTTPMNAVSASVSRGSGPNSEPGDERQRRDDEDRRHERLADPVREPLDRRLRALGVLDEGDDPGERRVGADPRRPEDERARSC